MENTSVVVTFDKETQKIIFSRIDNTDLKKLKTTFITEITIEHLKSLTLEQACRLTGENLFIFMEPTRKLLME